MPRLRPLLAVLVALLVAAALAACGGDDEDGGDGAGTQPATQAEQAPETATEETAPDDGGGDEQTSVEGSEFKFDPDRVTASRGDTIRFANAGSVPHNLTVEQPGEGRKLAGTPTIDGGQEETLEVDLEPGRYVMVCTVPGHRDAGMVGDFVVR